MKGTIFMRFKQIPGTVIVLLALGLVGTLAVAQDAPAGSYQQSCSDVSVKKGDLHAKCKDDKGKVHSAKLAGYGKCSDIANKNGNLVCAAAASQGGSASGAPAGSYTQSCKDIQMKGNTLRAVCKDHTGKDTPTVLRDVNRCAQGVVNLDGFLNCETDVLPPGSYMSNCKDPRIVGGTLYASCDNGKDKSLPAKLNNADLCTGDIENHEGNLRCVESKGSKR
jgi:hypothetical protein